MQHALQDLRRKNNARQIPLDDADVASLNTDNGTTNGDYGRHLRSPSVGSTAQVDAVQRAASFSLTPMPEAKPPAEEEQEAKFGTAVSIRVEMVYDPRLPIKDLNRDQVKTFESPVIVKTRQVRTTLCFG